MRWCAAATISLTLLAVGFGCSGSDDRENFILPPADGGASGARPSSGKAGAAHAGSSGVGSDTLAGSGGDSGSAPDAESAGAAESGAGAAQGGSTSAGGSAGDGGAAPVATLPSAPSDLVLKVASATSVQLSWTDNADNETGYQVYWSESASKPAQPNRQLGVDVTSIVADALITGKSYNFWVEADNDVGASADITGQATPLPVPATPSNVTIQTGPTDALLGWTDMAVGEQGYRIYLATSNTQPASAQYELPADASSFTVPGSDIDPYVKYYYWIVAYDSVGESMPGTISGTTGVAPLAPSGVAVDTSNVRSVAVSWLDNSAYSSGFDVYWSTDDTQPASPGATVPGTATSYQMKSVQGNSIYRFWIESVNPVGTSAPGKGTASKATYDLVWTDLYYDPNANTIHQAITDTFGLLTDNDATTGLYGYHTTSQTLGNAATLNPGINWNPSSAGIDLTQTESFWSEARTPNGSTFSVRTLVPPGALGSVSATPSQLSVALSWQAVTPIGGYQIYKGSSTTFANASSIAVQTGTSITVKDLNPGTAYTFWVRPLGTGLNGTGLPGASVMQSTVTTGTAVGPNLALGATAVASSDKTDAAKILDGNVTTHWQAASNATSEWIYVNLGDGNAKNITHVKLVWESSYATSYDIQICAETCDDNAATAVDSWAWVTAYSGSVATLSGFPNYQFVPLTTPTVGQFIRMKPKTLSGSSGASLDEFEIFSAP